MTPAIGLRTPDLRPEVWLYGQRDLVSFQFDMKLEDSIFGGGGGTGTGEQSGANYTSYAEDMIRHRREHPS